MITWSLEERNIKDLKKHPKNPRFISKEKTNQLKNNIDRFGLIDKPIINTDNTIIGGHQRIEILKKDKVSTVLCWVPSRELTEKEVLELNLTLNRLHGEFDYDILANEFEVPDLLDWGFTVDELHLFDEDVKPKASEKEKDQEPIECPKCGHSFKPG